MRSFLLWIQAFRPKTLVASFVPVAVGSGLAWATKSRLDWEVVFFTLTSAMAIQIGTNLMNDAIDFKKGADTPERMGPSRVTASGYFSYKQVMFAGVCAFFIAFLLGIPLALKGGSGVILIGLFSIILGYFYTAGPYALAYTGLGDFFVILFFGIVAVATTYFLHTKAVDTNSLIAGLQVGFLAAVLIAINNLRDIVGDAKVNKKTIPVRFGVNFAKFEIATFVFLPFLLGLHWIHLGMIGPGLLPLLGLFLARDIVKGILAHEPGTIYNRYLARAALLQVLFGTLFLMGLMLWKT